MRAQRRVEAGQVVAVAAGADHGQPLGDDDEVAHAVGRQLEARAGLVARQHDVDAGSAGNARARRPRVGVRRRQVDRRERAQRAVVDDVRIGDRQDHARARRAVRRVEHVLQEDDVRPAEGVGLRVHAVIGGDDDGRAQRVELREIAVHHRVELVGGAVPGACLCWT